jgi:hypothetical protein
MTASESAKRSCMEVVMCAIGVESEYEAGGGRRRSEETSKCNNVKSDAGW